MERYIQQLIEDIHRATYHVKPPHDLWVESNANPLNDLELDDMTYVEKYLYGQEQPISLITRIAYDALPPPEKLNKEQQELLTIELEQLLDFFHFELEFPPNYPKYLRYPFIKKFWTESHVPLSFGTNHIELCDYDREGCPFEGYCTTCDEIEAQMKYDEEHEGTAGIDDDFEMEGFLPSREEIERWMKNNANDAAKENLPLHFAEDKDKDDTDFTPFYNGFYNDDGTKINVDAVPIPNLCIICKKYQRNNWDEDMLCTLTRNDQRDSDNFECGAFERI